MIKKSLSEFRKAVYQSLSRRADILFDLIDALTVAGRISSPVALSEQKPFRRKFGSVYDGLENGEMDIGEILSHLPHCMPEASETIAVETHVLFQKTEHVLNCKTPKIHSTQV